jgi:hypothetical protein
MCHSQNDILPLLMFTTRGIIISIHIHITLFPHNPGNDAQSSAYIKLETIRIPFDLGKVQVDPMGDNGK